MPKVATNSRQRKAPGQPTGATAEPVVDPPKWRKSRVGEWVTITKTKAKAQYHLNDADLARLTFEMEHRPIMSKSFSAKAYVYNKREVERIAWEKHGGPDAFDKYRKELKEKRAKRAQTKQAAAKPATLNTATSSAVAQAAPGPSHDGRSWVLDACNAALSWHDRVYANEYEGLASVYATASQRSRPLQAAHRFSLTYPSSRPTAPLPASPGMNALRAILAEAPRLPKEQAYGPFSCAEPVHVAGINAFHHPGPEEYYTYEWDAPYLNQLFDALCGVIGECGIGEEGWLSARWEVYDTYAGCIAGMSYDRQEGWTDGAVHWLDGAYPLHDRAFVVSSRSKSAIGALYNSLLPPATMPYAGRG